MVSPVETSIDGGLSSSEVRERQAAGLVNTQPDRTSRTYREIVRGNVLTRFNLIISALAAIVLAVGSPIDALFAVVMVVNALVGIVQEIRAKRTLDHLRLLVAPRVTVRRDHVVVEIVPAEVVQDDLVILRTGDQVPVDGRLVEVNGLEVDESALTGESDPVAKRQGDEVLSGSAVVAGSATVVAERVGDQAWIHRLVVQAKAYQPATSELRTGVDQILRIVGWALVPLTALLFWSQLRSNESTSDGLISAVAGVVGLVPQGLVLLVSMALAVAVIRLARDHVVIQELHAVEGLARVDVFCVDKTGTLTTGSMQVESFRFLEGQPDLTRRAVAGLARADPNPTTTMRVIGESLAGIDTSDVPVGDLVPFSSERKWSAVTFKGDAVQLHDPTWVLGAPEILLERIAPRECDSIRVQIDRSAGDARRVVLVASAGSPLVGSALPERLTARALIELSERIRPDAAETMDYFRRQNVSIKVISGDNPITVSAVAARIGLEHADRSVDMREIDVDGDPDEFSALVERTAVFGRVLPEQKRLIVEALQRAGHRVAMTGDGVNDIPALKRADIGIAVDTATPATKAISQLILLGGRFDRMPHVVAEGRRVIANMERVSALFVTKTVYSAVFALAIGLSGSVFPFLPRQMSLVSELTIGVPAFILSFRSADDVSRPGYLRRVLRFAVPAGLAAAAVTLATYWTARSTFGGSTLEQSRSASTVALVLFAFWVLYELMMPTDRLDALLLTSLIVAFAVLVVAAPIRNFYRLVEPPTETVIATGLVVGGAIIASQFLVRVRSRR